MKYYHYAVVNSGKSIDQSPQFSFEKYEDFKTHLEDYYNNISQRPYPYAIGSFPTQALMRNMKQNTPLFVVSFIYTSDNPNEWVTKAFMSSIVVWTSERDEE